MQPIKVGAKSNPDLVAGAIAGEVTKNRVATVTAIGEAAVYKAVRAITVARRYLAAKGVDLICTPGMDNSPNPEGQERTFIKFIVEPRH